MILDRAFGLSVQGLLLFLSNITAIKTQEKCPFQLLYGCKPKLAPSLRVFGEMGVVTTKVTFKES